MNNEFEVVTDDAFLRELQGDVATQSTEGSESKDLLAILNDNIKEREEGVVKDNNPSPTPSPSPVNEGGEEPPVDEGGEDKSPDEGDDDLTPTSKRFGVKDTIFTLIETGEWEDTGVRYNDKEYESIEELLSKEKPTKELFEMLSSAQKKLREEDISNEYIRIGSRDSVKAKLIDAIVNDVPYDDLLEYHRDVIEPLQRIQFSAQPNGEQLAADFVAKCLVEIDGYHPASVGAAVEEMRKNFTLFSNAEKYQDLTFAKYEEEIENRMAEQQRYYAEMEAQYQKDLSGFKGVAGEIGFTDRFTETLSNLRFQQDPDTQMYHYQRLIDERLASDPQFAVDLMHFLVDQEDFVNRKRSNVQAESTKRVLELVGISKKTKGSTRSASSAEESAFLKELGMISE